MKLFFCGSWMTLSLILVSHMPAMAEEPACNLSALDRSLKGLHAVLDIYREKNLRQQQKNFRFLGAYYDEKKGWWVTEVLSEKNQCAANAWKIKWTADCQTQVNPVMNVTAMKCRL